MKNKIIKYTKFIISVALILSLIAPSYASLSASDGSAFVTKAEFDSALADFNSRLTTFEAGINSKIDSQVTSYLDRNGIWNGKKQKIKNDKWDYTKGSEAFKVDSSQNLLVSGHSLWSKVCVEKIDKAGLCIVDWEYGDTSGVVHATGNWWGMRVTTMGGGNGSSNNAMLVAVAWKNTTDNKTLSSEVLFNQTSQWLKLDGTYELTAVATIPVTPVHKVSMFFVPKDIELVQDATITVEFSQLSTSKSEYSIAGQGDISIWIKQIEVY